MGLFGNRESEEDVALRIRNSEAAKLFSRAICSFFTEDDEHFHWLMGNSSERMYQLQVFQNGVSLKQVEVNQWRLKQTGTYDVDSEGWSFGASGFEDLPNSTYIRVFKRFLLDQIKENCPNVIIAEYDYIKLAQGVMKGW